MEKETNDVVRLLLEAAAKMFKAAELAEATWAGPFCLGEGRFAGALVRSDGLVSVQQLAAWMQEAAEQLNG